MDTVLTTRRDLLLAPLLAALAPALFTNAADAARVDPAMTIIRLPDQLDWDTPPGFPARSLEMAPLWSKPSDLGLYYTLVRWHPGYMSAPHWYATDRYSMVLSGTWWVASGEKFDPENTIPVPAGSFVRRVAKTPHYDGVKRGAKEPAVIAICGIGPIKIMLTDEHKLAWRKLS